MERPNGVCLWLCGLPGSGRSTIAGLVADQLRRRDLPVEVLDEGVNAEHLVLSLYRSDPASEPDLRRLAHVASLLAQRGTIAIVASDSSKHALRESIRASIPEFVEVFVDAPRDVCAERRGYEAVDASPFEPPFAPDVRVVSYDRTADASAAQVVSYLEQAQVIPG